MGVDEGMRWELELDVRNRAGPGDLNQTLAGIQRWDENWEEEGGKDWLSHIQTQIDVTWQGPWQGHSHFERIHCSAQVLRDFWKRGYFGQAALVEYLSPGAVSCFSGMAGFFFSPGNNADPFLAFTSASVVRLFQWSWKTWRITHGAGKWAGRLLRVLGTKFFLLNWWLVWMWERGLCYLWDLSKKLWQTDPQAGPGCCPLPELNKGALDSF